MTPPPLWGGILDNVEIDLLRQRISLSLHVIEGTEQPRTDHVLILADISDFHWFTSIPGPWSYAEITEVHMTEAPDEGTAVEIMLWSEDAGISVIARSVRLDGTEMTPQKFSEL